MRMEAELRSRKMRTELVKFKYYQLRFDFFEHLFYFLSLAGFLFLWLTRNNSEEWVGNLRMGNKQEKISHKNADISLFRQPEEGK